MSITKHIIEPPRFMEILIENKDLDDYQKFMDSRELITLPTGQWAVFSIKTNGKHHLTVKLVEIRVAMLA